MVHRHLRDMGLPSEVHTVADTLIAKLGRYVEACCTKNRADSMHYLLPMDRYVRGEVFAMAVVVVVARLVFKLDGDFEVSFGEISWKRSICMNPLVKFWLIGKAFASHESICVQFPASLPLPTVNL